MKWVLAPIAMKHRVICASSTQNQCCYCHSKAAVRSMKWSMATILGSDEFYIWFYYRYIICYGMSRVERQCPDGLNFDSVSRMCKQPENAKCEDDSDIDDTEPSNSTIVCRDNDQVEFVPSLNSCEEYYICANGTATAHNCSEENVLIYNIEKRRCTPTGRCIHDYEPICTTSGALMPHLFECRHYFYCASDQVRPILHVCRLGELFDRNTLRCAAEETVHCPSPPNDDLEEWPANRTNLDLLEVAVNWIKWLHIYKLFVSKFFPRKTYWQKNWMTTFCRT